MCGIVGVASNGPMSHQMKEFFQSLLFHDVVRGDHATGVAGIDTMTRDVVIVKKAIPSPAFLVDKELMEPLFATKHNFNIYIGHNRWATKGAKDDDNNAHPFQHGHITGVHNGSLRNQSLLDDSKDFVVDSDNLFYHMSQNGVDGTIEKTDGAYSLVWYDAETNELNFIRNNERPMAVAKLTNGCYVWASEMGLIRWLVKRSKGLAFATYKENGEDYEHCYNTQVMGHMRLPFNDKTRTMEGHFRASKKTEPTFPSLSRYSSRASWTDYDYYGTGQSSGSTTAYVPHWKKESWKYFQEILPAVKEMKEMDDTNLQLKFLGNIEEVSRGNSTFRPKISRFEFKNVKGETFIFHCFCHGTGVTNDWGDDKIGQMVYARVGSFTETSSQSYDSIQNRTPKGSYQVGVISVSERRPNRLFLYMEDAVKKEATTNVVDFRGAGSSGEEASKEGSKDEQKVIFVDTKGNAHPDNRSGSNASRVLRPPMGSGPGNPSPARKSDLVEGDTTEDFLKKKVKLGNTVTTQGNLIDMLQENSGRCCECNTPLWSIGHPMLHLHPHYDRDQGKTIEYLLCSEKCFDSMVEITDIMDADYEATFGLGGSNEV